MSKPFICALFFKMETSSWYYSLAYFTLTISISQEIPLIGKNVREANPGEFSFIVSIGRLYAANVEDRQFCTGTLISPDKVLTTAHCLLGERVFSTEIIVGSASLPQGKRYRPKTWTSYDMWKKKVARVKPSLNDIAVITLTQSVDLHKLNVTPAEIQTSADQRNSKVRIAGWGVVEDGTVPTVMRTAEVKIISKDECESVGSVANVFYVHDNFFCSLADPWVLSSCGDSGAPILNENNQLIGINIGVCPDAKKLNLPHDIPNDQKRNLHLNLHNFVEFIEVMKVA